MHAETGKSVYIDLNPKTFALPNYFKEHKGPFINNTVYLLSDAHLSLYAREWGTDFNKTMDKLITISRHKDIDFILSTQETSRLDKNIITAVDAVIFKEPSLLASEFERPEVRKLVEEANEVFKPLGKKEKLETAYAITQTGRHVVTDIHLPFYWSNELSKRYGKLDWDTSTPESRGTVLKIRYGT